MFYEKEKERERKKEREAISGTFIQLQGADTANTFSRAYQLTCCCAILFKILFYKITDKNTYRKQHLEWHQPESRQAFSQCFYRMLY